jgi:hypothetical protein
VAADDVSGNPRLLPAWREEPVGPSAVLGALADGENRRVVDRTQTIVDNDPRAYR